MRDLTPKEIARQDLVDNAIFSLITELIPNGTSIEWDIEIISDVREKIRVVLEEKGIVDEIEFYPYLQSPSCQKYDD